MMRRVFPLGAVALLLGAAPVHAADLPTLPMQGASLPALAADPNLADSGWKGWTFGVGVSAVASKGARGQFGGDTFVGYDHLFANDVALSVQFDTGYAPNLAPWTGAKGFDFATITATTVFNASSNVRPYITASGSAARGLTSAWNGNPMNAYDTLNGVFGGPGQVQALGSVGAGVAIDVAPHMTFVMGVSGGNGVGLPAEIAPGF